MPDESLADILQNLESYLLRPGVRRDPQTVSSLLTDDFCEYGSSGKVYSKQQVIDALSFERDREFDITDFSVTTIAPHAALARYTAHEGASASLRSSVWAKRDDKWQMLFHQGTKLR